MPAADQLPKTPSYRKPEYVGAVARAIRHRIRYLGLTHAELVEQFDIDRQAAHRAIRGHHLNARNQTELLAGLGLVIVNTDGARTDD